MFNIQSLNAAYKQIILTELFAFIEINSSNDKFENISQIFKNLDIKNCHIIYLMGLIRLTECMKDKIPEFENFVSKTKIELKNRNLNIKKLFRGL